MRDYTKLRWDDAFTATDRQGIADVTSEALAKILNTAEGKDIVVPIVIADKGYNNDFSGCYVYQLEVTANGLRIVKDVFFWQTKKIVPVTASLLEEWKVSYKDVEKAAEKIGVEL